MNVRWGGLDTTPQPERGVVLRLRERIRKDVKKMSSREERAKGFSRNLQVFIKGKADEKSGSRIKKPWRRDLEIPAI